MPNDPSKKYWWIIGIVVPIVVAVIGVSFRGDKQVVGKAADNGTATTPETQNQDGIPDQFIGKWHGRISNKDGDAQGNKGWVTSEYTIKKDGSITIYIEEIGNPTQNITGTYDGAVVRYTANTGFGSRAELLHYDSDGTLNVRAPRTRDDPPGDNLVQEGHLTRN